MSERIRSNSSTWDLNENHALPRQYIRDILPENREPVYISNESQRARNQQQVNCDNFREHDRIFGETGGGSSTLLDAPHPCNENESYFTNMSPGLDNWKLGRHQNSLDNWRQDSSYRYISQDNGLNGQYSRSCHANPMATFQNNERRNIISNKFGNYTNQNIEIGTIRSDINASVEQPLRNNERRNIISYRFGNYANPNLATGITRSDINARVEQHNLSREHENQHRAITMPSTSMMPSRLNFQNQQMLQLRVTSDQGEVIPLVEESTNGTVNEEKRNDMNKRSFRLALIDYIKEILKPKWKVGVISRDSYKAIVKKSVDKVLNSIPTANIPSSQEEITNYLSSSDSKLAKLVEAYVEKYHRT